MDAADGAPINALYVNDDGNIGIGSTTPVNKLDLVGDLSTQWSATNLTGIKLDRSNSDSSEIQYRINNGKIYTQLVSDYLNHRFIIRHFQLNLGSIIN